MGDNGQGGGSEHDSGSKDRATVALVYRAVDDLAKLTEAHFETVKLQLQGLSILPTRVAELSREVDSLRTRVAAIENNDQSELTAAQQRRTFRTQHLPALIFGLMGVMFAAVNIYLYLRARH